VINKSIKFFALLFLTLNVYAGGDDRDQVYYENLDQELAAFEAQLAEDLAQAEIDAFKAELEAALAEQQIEDELRAYNPLIPKGNELVATLMFEIDDIDTRQKFLNQVGGIEESVYIQIKEEKIMAVPEKDIDRTSAEGKASSVQFIHFPFTEDQITKFKDLSNEVSVGVNHDIYNYKTKILDKVRIALMKDLD